MAALMGYLLGSIPFGLLLTRLFNAGDLRQIGSGNIGTTNVLRTGRKGLAAATLLLDGGKGAVAVLLAGYWYAPDAAIVAGLLAVFGHNFPMWLRFKGGKGVATTLGVLLALSWPAGVATCLTWLVVAVAFRYSSLSALVAFAASPIYMYFLGDENKAVLAVLLAVLGIARHHENIKRLMAGEESKIGQK
ncbi:glycerol-3-phosphate 1-O-acyltransferase PlsY [Terasakiella sp. A23]|uniref:glycerol-3-phosphate 1-O-acyltransferase PlsY n=1 Tax=Terasakiella sp. FCG-A23 TaxID=3080561 RepID=UPI0029530394|nr:glycerol-3-phosphate 1-O-acyltransferase PlsY [Terasakiella sp. A23]MDV7341671.1 glycerol-3-phosphate 1-O-acyltransferase PlsY [Terasakiella sp. A23]